MRTHRCTGKAAETASETALVAAVATAAVTVVGATACACESPCTARQGRSKSERGMRTALDGMQGSASAMGERTPFSTIVPRRKGPKARHHGESNPSSLEQRSRLGHQSEPEML